MDDVAPPLFKVCPRCLSGRPESEFDRSPDGVCATCWRQRYAAAAITLSSLVQLTVLEVPGGFRRAKIVDGEFERWLCEHTHASERSADGCLDARPAT